MGSAAPRGRGRLSDIDMLPDWADEAKLWAFEQLKERKRTQVDICQEFNARLRAAAWEQGIADPPQISPSAFNRTAVQIAILGRRLQETREIAAILAPKLEEAGDSNVTMLIAGTIESLLREMLTNAGQLPADGDTAEMLMMTSRALKHAVEAKRITTDMRARIEKEFAKKAGAAISEAGKRQGLSKERIEQLRDDFLGLSKPEKKT